MRRIDGEKDCALTRGDLTDAESLRTERGVSIHEFGKVDLKFLEKMPMLEEFMCKWANEVENLDSLRSLKKLKSLSISDIKMRDIEFLEGFPDDFELEMSATIENAIDIDKLKRFLHHDIYEMTIRGKRIPDTCFERR